MRTWLAEMITLKSLIRSSSVPLAAIMIIAGAAQAIPPHPDLLKARIAQEGTDCVLAPLPNPTELLSRGIEAPEDCFGTSEGGRNELSIPGVKQLRILAILVDFTDQMSQTRATFFDSLVFGPGTGTVGDYFREISRGRVDIVTVNMPSTLNWIRAPRNYAYYADNDFGIGPYPQNSQKLVEDLVDAVDPVVDFGNYDNDGDGDVDVLFVVHAGISSEVSGDAHDIWSHKWGITPRLTGEGVYVSAYTIQPEFWFDPGDMTCGVSCHELLHGFGLPDLIDMTFRSYGVGRWDIMALGSWNGRMGDSPAHPGAWSLIQLGLARAVNVRDNRPDELIRPIGEEGGLIYKLWNYGTVSPEYFLLENRRRFGYDAALPGEGLLIWHIDRSKYNNDQLWYPGLPGRNHFMVALEQAEGRYDLEHHYNMGDDCDPWPGSVDRMAFDSMSSPSSNSYTAGATMVGVKNINVTPEGIRADLMVRRSSKRDPVFAKSPEWSFWSQNYPNPFNPSTTIQYSLPEPCHVIVEIFDLLGRRVRTLVDQEQLTGPYTVTWDGTDGSGTPVATGVYLYKLRAGDYVQSKKMLLLK